MVDVRLYSHAGGTHSRTPIYTDYYLIDNEISAFNHRGRPWGGNRVRGRDVWRDLQERPRWTIASGPNWLLNINVNTSEGTTRSSGNTRDFNITDGLSHGIYLTNRIRRPCTVEIPYPLVNVNTRDGVFLHEGRVEVERLRRFSPAVIAIHLDLPDEEPFRKFKDLSNHLARVAEEPDDRGFFFWFIKRQRGQWNTPVKDSSLYFIDLNGKHLKYKIHAGDCIKFVVVITERNPLSSQSFSSTPSPTSQPRSSSIDSSDPSPPPSPPPSPHSPRPRTSNKLTQTDSIDSRDHSPPQPPPHHHHSPRPRTRNRPTQTDRIRTKNKAAQSRRTKDHEPFIDPGPTFYDGEEVLARWEDDRWYYKGWIARRYDVNNYYCVKDSTSQCDVINWEDIIRATDHYDAVSPDKRDRVRVLAPHPVYYWSYAPGRVIEAIGQKLTVRFYDNNQTNIEKWDVYPARNRQKYLKDVEDIQQREKDWEGKEAVIRDESGVYRPGRVNKQIGCQQRYTVTWEDGQCGEQMSIHIYGTYTKTIKFKVGSYILALADPDNNYFLPGEVTRVHEDGDVQRLQVDFVNGERSKDALSTDSYWMNKMAYTEAEEVFRMHHPESSDKEEVSR
ncbi:uncharacterized protein LOC124139604 isoform X13 [Haliotis rufescens]|uniref:uncharacterized protein LOC124139604 isoform X12 n=1 Tax=Haliotis rufescens TaxID=6454 RepID=UPI00201F41B7|nr:uncharacterized protein LOC124139604 isoform X12 [Haliotis rufescens]XP_048244041.1 uncharacterized protein LOC124139604 isoform X13 [Haliotis rufescens]